MHRPVAKLKRAAVVGIGRVPFSRQSGLSEQQMAVQAITSAAEDAGLGLDSIDGVVKFTADSNSEASLVNALGLPGLRFFAEAGYGGMAAGSALVLAHAAVSSGKARCIACFRSMNGRSGTRFGRGERMLRSESSAVAYAAGDRTFGSALTGPFGLLSPSQQMGLWANRYAHQYGIGGDDLSQLLAEVAIVQREYAADNRHAVLQGKPLTLSDYAASRMISSPLRAPDFCVEVDGAVAILVATLDLGHDATRKPVELLASHQSLKPHGETPSLYSRDLHRHAPVEAREIFGIAGVQPDEIDVLSVYDATSIMVPMLLEDLGFCEAGGASDFILGGQTRLDGRLPTNTHGGMLSEGYLHGLNNALEIINQLRNEAATQVGGAQIGMFSVGYASTIFVAS